MRYLNLFVLSLLTACASTTGQTGQGIEGKTVWVTGNRMPGPDTELPPPEPVKRWVYVTPVVTMNQMPEQTDGLYPSLPVDPVDSVQSSGKGHFRISLPAGTYSVFTREDGGYYANQFDSEGQVNPVTVRENSLSEITIEINYTAVY